MSGYEWERLDSLWQKDNSSVWEMMRQKQEVRDFNGPTYSVIHNLMKLMFLLCEVK